MTKLLLIFLISVVGVSFGQQAGSSSAEDEKPPLPNPILLRAPELSQWTILTTKPNGSPGGAAAANAGRTQDSSADGAKNTPPSFQKIVKSGKTYFEIFVDDAGVKWEKWNVNGKQVTFNSATGKAVIANSGMDSLYYHDYTKMDFAGFDWISSSNYVAFQKFDKSKCFIFRQKVQLYDGTTGLQTAVIDSETQLPVLLDIDGCRSVYKFEAPPAVPLVVPEKVKALLKPEPLPPNVPIPRSLRKSMSKGGLGLRK